MGGRPVCVASGQPWPLLTVTNKHMHVELSGSKFKWGGDTGATQGCNPRCAGVLPRPGGQNAERLRPSSQSFPAELQSPMASTNYRCVIQGL